MDSSNYFFKRHDNFLRILAHKAVKQTMTNDTKYREPYLLKFFENLSRQYPSLTGDFNLDSMAKLFRYEEKKFYGPIYNVILIRECLS
jgi:hypothetical protein